MWTVAIIGDCAIKNPRSALTKTHASQAPGVDMRSRFRAALRAVCEPEAWCGAIDVGSAELPTRPDRQAPVGAPPASNIADIL